jgi:hypothetical protein
MKQLQTEIPELDYWLVKYDTYKPLQVLFKYSHEKNTFTGDEL